MEIAFDLTRFRQELKKSQAQLGAATRPAAQAGSQVIYEAVLPRVPVSTQEHYFYGSASKRAPKGQKKAAAFGPFKPGTLRSAVYQAFSEKNSGPHKSEYHISVNAKKAPYAYMVHKRIPFVLSALHDNAPAAVRAIKTRYAQELAK